MGNKVLEVVLQGGGSILLGLLEIVFFCHKVLEVSVLSFKGDKVLQEVSTSSFSVSWNSSLGGSWKTCKV